MLIVGYNDSDLVLLLVQATEGSKPRLEGLQPAIHATPLFLRLHDLVLVVAHVFHVHSKADFGMLCWRNGEAVHEFRRKCSCGVYVALELPNDVGGLDVVVPPLGGEKTMEHNIWRIDVEGGPGEEVFGKFTEYLRAYPCCSTAGVDIFNRRA